MAITPLPADKAARLRVRIFVDFWNFSLSLRNEDDAFRVDWKPVGTLFTAEAGKLVDATAAARFEGIYTSTAQLIPKSRKT